MFKKLSLFAALAFTTTSVSAVELEQSRMSSMRELLGSEQGRTFALKREIKRLNYKLKNIKDDNKNLRDEIERMNEEYEENQGKLGGIIEANKGLRGEVQKQQEILDQNAEEEAEQLKSIQMM